MARNFLTGRKPTSPAHSGAAETCANSLFIHFPPKDVALPAPFDARHRATDEMAPKHGRIYIVERRRNLCGPGSAEDPRIAPTHIQPHLCAFIRKRTHPTPRQQAAVIIAWPPPWPMYIAPQMGTINLILIGPHKKENFSKNRGTFRTACAFDGKTSEIHQNPIRRLFPKKTGTCNHTLHQDPGAYPYWHKTPEIKPVSRESLPQTVRHSVSHLGTMKRADAWAQQGLPLRFFFDGFQTGCPI